VRLALEGISSKLETVSFEKLLRARKLRDGANVGIADANDTSKLAVTVKDIMMQ
jgi:hypothetical protein